MKISFNSIVPLFLFIFFIGCQDKEEERNHPITISYSPSGDSPIVFSINKGDTIEMLLGNAFPLYTEYEYDTFTIQYQEGIELTENTKGQYSCYPKEEGLFIVIFEDPGRADILSYFFLKVNSYANVCRFIETFYQLEAEDEAVKETIEKELNELYVCPSGSTYYFTHRLVNSESALSEGTAELIRYKMDEETIEGVFIYNGAVMNILNYNHVNQYYEIEKTTIASNVFYWIQDLTKLYQENYPEGNVQQVVVTSTITWN